MTILLLNSYCCKSDIILFCASFSVWASAANISLYSSVTFPRVLDSKALCISAILDWAALIAALLDASAPAARFALPAACEIASACAAASFWACVAPAFAASAFSVAAFLCAVVIYWIF